MDTFNVYDRLDAIYFIVKYYDLFKIGMLVLIKNSEDLYRKRVSYSVLLCFIYNINHLLF